MKAILLALQGKKTYITGFISILFSILSLAGVGIPGLALPILSHDAAIQTIVTSLLGMFIRNGVANTTGTPAAPKTTP